MKKITASILVIVLTLTLAFPCFDQRASAADQYIKADAFIKLLVDKLGITVDDSADNSYITAAITGGILEDGDIKDFSGYITRTDAAVLINRADEYLHGDTVETDLLSVVLKKRISDINKVSKDKREAVAKCFAKGIIKGFGNGYYIQNRSFKGSDKVTKATAKTMINLVINPAKRAKISPDGMLIRTTNLPKNANKYDYILACYPNSFYEKKFEFMLMKNWSKELKNDKYDFYGYPVEMKNEKFKNWYEEWSFKKEMDKHLYEWSALAEKYLHYLFNVNYKTVDNKWIEGLGALYVKSNRNEADDIRTFYIGKMKKNHVIVKSSIIAVEPSTLYSDGEYCMRAYVRYKITADDINVKQTKLIYSQYPALDNLKSGEWRTGVFDIRFATNNGSSGDGSDFAIDPMTHYVDAYNIPVK